jgi:hypothetical protein
MNSGGWGVGAGTEIDLRNPQDIYKTLCNQAEIVYLQHLTWLDSDHTSHLAWPHIEVGLGNREKAEEFLE